MHLVVLEERPLHEQLANDLLRVMREGAPQVNRTDVALELLRLAMAESRSEAAPS